MRSFVAVALIALIIAFASTASAALAPVRTRKLAQCWNLDTSTNRCLDVPDTSTGGWRSATPEEINPSTGAPYDPRG